MAGHVANISGTQLRSFVDAVGYYVWNKTFGKLSPDGFPQHSSSARNLRSCSTTSVTALSSKRWSPCLFVGMNIYALRVFDQLPFERLCIANLNDAGGNREEFGNSCGTIPPRSCDQLEAIRVGTHGDWLDEAMMLDALGQLLELVSSKLRPGLVIDSWMVSIARY